MTDLIDTTEMYLKAILELEEEGITPMRARIAERLDHSGPTVSQTVGRMERDGLLIVEDDRRLSFTDEGRLTAVEVMRKHRLAELMLLEIVGLSWEKVHEEACRWEHVMSEEVERKLLERLNNPTHSPFGMPIPGLELLGLPGVESVSCLSITEAGEGSFQLCRIGEPVQIDPSFLSQMANLGLKPGVFVQVAKSGSGYLMTAQGQAEGLLLDERYGQHLFISSVFAK
jgi:DtxR family Mn-dependent transcriptional regulator